LAIAAPSAVTNLIRKSNKIHGCNALKQLLGIATLDGEREYFYCKHSTKPWLPSYST